ncbi:MAG: ATP synthase F1 subunit delta [Candidatus Zipacnadales bacterium]
MRNRKAAARYARAFFEDALAREAIDAASADLSLLKEIWRHTPELVSFLDHPLVSPQRKRALCETHLGKLVHAEQMRFLDLLIDRGRIPLLPDICDLFLEIVDDHRGIIRADVRSAVPLTETEQLRLHTLLGQVFGRKPLTVMSVHPELIGGVAVRVKDCMLDGSVRTSLKMLASALRTVPIPRPSLPDEAADKGELR